jgi:predicted TIM-barrel fold metal-dependent hydrolase
MISRRDWMVGAIAFAATALADDGRKEGILIDSHMHLFAGDPIRFPYNSGSYKPKPLPVEEYVKFVQKAQINHTVIVHPEPYQDDHRYLEYCFAHEPSPHFFKGTCLFDPIDPKTPKRMEVLMLKNRGRIVALRIHETHPAGTPSTTTGVIRDRDLKDPQMLVTWRAAHELGLAIQVHFIPHYATQIGELAAKFPNMPIVLDHLARPGEGTPEEYEQVLKLAALPRVYMKYSSTGVESATKEPFPHRDVKPLVKRVYEAYGPDKIIWGGLGGDMATFQREVQLFDLMFDFAPELGRKKIRGLTAQKLFAFPQS